MILPKEHPQRLELSNEVHARPPESLDAPLRVSYLALLADAEARAQGWRALQALARDHDLRPPDDDAIHFSADFGSFRLKGERHTEFLRLKFIAAGAPVDQDDPFAEPAIASAPADWVAALPGELLVAANVLLLRDDRLAADPDRIAHEYFAGNTLIGGSIGAAAARAFTDFHIYPDGFSRVLVLDRALTPRQAGRMVQRLVEIDTYRILALMALPVARALTGTLAQGEGELADITGRLAAATPADEARLFDRLSLLEADIERAQAQNLYRFSASDAYHNLVLRRISELREERLGGLQTFQEFTERRLAPAMNTCRAVAARQEQLSQRLARVTQLLSTRVDITREEQTQGLLESMDRRARVQLRLQETVEGLSVAAITYYIVGLVGYAAKGLKSAGVPLDVEIVVGIAIPLVAGLIYLGMRRIHRAVRKHS